MEIIAQWLDDLDDVILTLPVILERFRWRCLQIGVLAAACLTGIALAGRFLSLMPVLASVAASSLALWAAALVGVELTRLTDPGARASFRSYG